MRIGFQGEIGSNSDQAARNMARKMGFGDVEFVPLVQSKNVVTALNEGDIDYGVVAVNNSTAGTVAETFEALKDESFDLVCTETLDIHHNLYVYPGTPLEDVRFVASHPQALKQTVHNRAQRYPQLEEVGARDTATAAKQLAEGKLSADTAVLCRDTAGTLYGLELVEEHLEDDPANRTEFHMFERAMKCRGGASE